MLQFIVLGQIPGTSLQLDFNDVLRFSAIFVLILILAIEFRRYKSFKSFRQRQMVPQAQS